MKNLIAIWMHCNNGFAKQISLKTSLNGKNCWVFFLSLNISLTIFISLSRIIQNKPMTFHVHYFCSLTVINITFNNCFSEYWTKKLLNYVAHLFSFLYVCLWLPVLFNMICHVVPGISLMSAHVTPYLRCNTNKKFQFSSMLRLWCLHLSIVHKSLCYFAAADYSWNFVDNLTIWQCRRESIEAIASWDEPLT